jgi:predicted nucleic acid-binding protein
MSATALVDTNVLVYRFDPRFPRKQTIANELLRAGIADGSLHLPHQAVVEFVAAVTRAIAGGEPLLPRADALREAEELLTQFELLYPDEELLRLALRGVATYQLSWFDAHMWAYAERFGLDQLVSEDFQDGRMYGTVEMTNPFATGGAG